MNDLIYAANFSPLSLQAPNSWCGHLPFAAWIIKFIEPKIFVELGSYTGNSYFSFCQSVNDEKLKTKCYAVDTWQGDGHSGNYDDNIFHQVNSYNEKNYSQFSRLLRMKFDDAVTYFADQTIELLHIDGFHSYEAVKHDFETWLPKLAPNAVILFHDTNVRERDFGVWKFWEELCITYPHNLEFSHSHGLGVLQLNVADNAKKIPWLSSSPNEKQHLKNYFSALGEKQLDRLELAELKIRESNLNQMIYNLNQANAILNQRIDDLNHSITSILSSTSWRITKVIRFIKNIHSGR